MSSVRHIAQQYSNHIYLNIYLDEVYTSKYNKIEKQIFSPGKLNNILIHRQKL